MILQKLEFSAWKCTSIKTIAKLRLFNYELKLNYIKSFVDLPLIRARQKQSTRFQFVLRGVK